VPCVVPDMRGGVGVGAWRGVVPDMRRMRGAGHDAEVGAWCRT
jgi:hypothetical protein